MLDACGIPHPRIQPAAAAAQTDKTLYYLHINNIKVNERTIEGMNEWIELQEG